MSENAKIILSKVVLGIFPLRWFGQMTFWQTFGNFPAKSKFTIYWLFFIYLQMYFLGVGMPRSSMGVFPKNEGGMQVLEGLAPSSQTAGSLLRIPWLAKPAGRIIWAKLQLQIFIYLQTYFYFLTNSLKRKLFTKKSTTSFLYLKIQKSVRQTHSGWCFYFSTKYDFTIQSEVLFFCRLFCFLFMEKLFFSLSFLCSLCFT